MTKILMYHSVGGKANAEVVRLRSLQVGAGLYCVPTERFREQMQYLAQGSAKKEIIITFDDGLLDNYTNAYPILKEFGLKAYFFILAGKVGTGGYMNWGQIRELKNSGMIIGSHGVAHRILTELNDAELDYELSESKKMLEDKLGERIDFFSVPRGFYNKKVIAKAKDAGYKAVFTSVYGDRDEFKLGRIPVKASWDLAYFIRIVNGGLSLKDKGKELIKNASKKMLGAKNYDRLRTGILIRGRHKL